MGPRTLFCLGEENKLESVPEEEALMVTDPIWKSTELRFCFYRLVLNTSSSQGTSNLRSLREGTEI